MITTIPNKPSEQVLKDMHLSYWRALQDSKELGMGWHEGSCPLWNNVYAAIIAAYAEVPDPARAKEPTHATLVFETFDRHEWAFRITNTGNIEINPKYTVEESAKIFWDAVRSSDPFTHVTPVMWRYELAHAIQSGEYTDWHWHTTDFKPTVPKGSIRNLQELGVINREPIE
jgi:hypothetical protein